MTYKMSSEKQPEMKYATIIHVQLHIVHVQCTCTLSIVHSISCADVHVISRDL